MSTAFVPLFPDIQSPAGVSATAGTVSERAPGSPGFAALIPDCAPATPRTHRAEVTAAAASAPLHDRLPVVTLKREGDKVTRIQVRCSCGEVVELDCVY